MPELPEVEALARFVGRQATGRRVSRAYVASFSALKTFDPPLEALVGRTLVEPCRRGKHLCLPFDDMTGDRIWLIVHLARGGWLKWIDVLATERPKLSPKSPLAFRVGFDEGDGFDVTEAGTEKRLKGWVVRDPDAVENIATLGPEPLDPSFDVAALGACLAATGGRHLKGALADQSVIAGIGNAYSDEILHTARLSPYKPAGKLTADELATLHSALVSTLADALERSVELPAKGLKAEKKGGLAVHGRVGQNCPVCGDVVREVSFATKALQYCATCQTGGKPLADRRMSRLLK